MTSFYHIQFWLAISILLWISRVASFSVFPDISMKELQFWKLKLPRSMAFLENIFVRRIFRVWKHCSRRPRVVTRDFYHQHFLFGVRATSSLELILHLRRVVQQKNQFFFFQILDRGQKYLIRVFLQLSNSLKQTIWVSHFGK